MFRKMLPRERKPHNGGHKASLFVESLTIYVIAVMRLMINALRLRSCVAGAVLSACLTLTVSALMPVLT